MPTFVYKAKRSPSQRVRGKIDAPDRPRAIQKLQATGLSLMSLSEDRLGGALSLRRVKLEDLAVFWRQLASLLEAGLPLVKALATIHQQTQQPAMSRVVAQVIQAVENASSFSAALAQLPRTFDALTVSVIASGEAGGTLDKVAQQLAVRTEKQQELRGKLRSAMTYPAFLLIVGSGVVGVLVTWVIPKFEVMFKGMGKDLPALTNILLNISRWSQQYWYLALAGIAMLVMAYVHANRQPATRRMLDLLRLKLPVAGPVILKIEAARFAQTLGSLVSGGVPILDALSITGRSAGNRVIADDVETIRSEVARGARLEAAMRKSGHFPPSLVNLVAVGEDTASLDQMLVRAGTMFERESDRVIATMTKMLESVLIVIFGAVVAGVVAAILLPVFQATSFVE